MMEWLREKMAMFVAMVQSMFLTRVQPKLASERGDTNFISILIILGIVILLAGVFIGFKDTIVGKVREIVEGFEIH